jgi:hypothetical protein
VASQLNTFNNFMIGSNIRYIEYVKKNVSSKKNANLTEKEELQDRLEIQTGVLETLEK